MQHTEQSPSIGAQAAYTQYSVRQRLLSGSLTLAMTSSAAVTAAVAHAGPPAPPSFSPALSGGPVHVVHPVSPFSPVVHSFHPVPSAGSSHGWQPSSSLVHNLLTTTTGVGDINLGSATALFSLQSLAGFNQITIDVGGKQTVVNTSTRLTGAELVAAEQVLAGSKQTLVVNASGVATGGTFNLNGSTVSALDGVVGGSIHSLDISHGVTAVDSLSNLSLLGSLVNLGTIDVGAKGQTLDTISAANITNAAGGMITSTPHANTAIGLDASGAISNSGKISGTGDVNLSAPTINNSSLISSANGNVNLTGGGGNLTVTGTGGTVQATHGNINFNDANYSGNSNITVTGGNWLSQQVNFNAGTGNIEANVGEVSGVVNGTASNSHVTAATGNLLLGDMNVSGDPSYYNTAGNILITGTVTGDPDLAIVASGNIIASGGALDTHAGNGNITLIAGANFVPTPANASVLNTSGAGDTTNTLTITDSTAAGKGSKTGGFVDLSGSTLGGKGTALTSITSGNGNILMVAYKGTGANSGSIIGTGTIKSTGTANLDAGTGTVTMIGGGAQITAQNINAGNVTILGTTPTLGATPMTILDGTITGGAYVTTPATFTNTAINLTSIATGGNVAIGTGGKTNTSSTAPLSIGNASGLSFTGTSASSSLFVHLNNGGVFNINPSSIATGGTLSVDNGGGDIFFNGNISGNGTIILTSGSTIANNPGFVISGAAANLTAEVIGGGIAFPLNVAVNTLSANSSGGGQGTSINELASSGKSLTLNASSSLGSGNFLLTSLQTVNVKGAITSVADIDLTETGSTNAVGLSIGAVLTAGSGKINLTTTGTDTITATKTIAATNLTIAAGGNVGTSAGLPTNVSGTLTINGAVLTSTTPAIFIKDANTGALTVNSNGGGGNGTALTLTSVSSALTLGQLLFNNVTVTDTVAAATTTIAAGAGNSVGTGIGAVKITTSGALTQTTGEIAGNTVTLSSTANSLGASGAGSLDVAANVLTAGATKGSVFVTGEQNMTVNAGTALNAYTVLMAAGTTLNIGGTLSVTAKAPAVPGTLTLTADDITQGPTTAFLSAQNVSLNTTSGTGFIGLGPSAQSIQTKAILSLSIEGVAGSTAFVTQNGSIVLGATSVMTGGAVGGGSTLNLAVAAGNKLTVENSILWDNNNITAPSSLTVTTPGTITGTNATITSPSVILNAPNSIVVGATGTASFVSSAGLAINGSGSVNFPTGSSLSLNGLSSITLGVGGAVATDPLQGPITGGSLANLTIFSRGALNANYSSFTSTNSLSVTASSLNNTGGFNAGPFNLTSGNVTLGLNGATTIGNSTVTSGQPQFDITSTINGDGISVSSGNILTVNVAGLNFNGTAGNSIALSGSALKTPTAGGLPSTYFTTDNTFNSVSLGASGGAFVVGGTGTQLNNGIAGGVTATNGVTITAPSSLTVVNGSAISGNQITLNTSNFKLNDTSTVAGTGVLPSLTISSPSGLTIGGTLGTNNIGGTYSNNFDSVTLQAATGGVNVGQLFTANNGTGNMLDNGSVTNLSISAAAGSNITLPSTLTNSILQVASGGNIFLSGAGISFSPPATQQRFLTLQATGGNVSLFFTPAVGTTNLTLGQAVGAIDISVGSSGSFSASTTNTLTVNETQSVTNASLFGSTITVNQNVTASKNLNVQALGSPTSVITEATGISLVANTLTVAQSMPTLPVTPLNVQAANVNVVSGALSLSDTFAGSVNLQQLTNPLAPLTALTFVNNAGPGATTLTVGNLAAVAGGISITNIFGGLFVSDGSVLLTANQNIFVPAGTDGTKGTAGTFISGPTLGGNIALQNNDPTGTIEIGQGVLISAFATAGSGLGQVSITRGAVPTTGLLAGSQPTPNPPLVTTMPGGQVFYTTTANPTGSITSFNAGGPNQLKANGANIIFNGAGNKSYIQLDGGDTIIADPPPVAAASAPLAASVALVNSNNVMSGMSATSGLPTVSNLALNASNGVLNQGSNFNTSNALPIVNWSLPTTTAISANLASGMNNGAAGLGDSELLSVGTGAAYSGAASGGLGKGTKVLTGGVTNISDSVKTLDNGATLLAPKTQTTLNSRFGSVNVAAGSVVMVMAFDGGLAVYNLHDTKNGAVQIKVGDNTLNLSPGQNAVLTNKQIRSFEEINPVQVVSYRHMTAKQWANGVKGFQSEFDIRSMLLHVGALKGMVQAQDSDSRRAMNSILKTSAILSQLGGGQYQYMVAPVKTAMAIR